MTQISMVLIVSEVVFKVLNSSTPEDWQHETFSQEFLSYFIFILFYTWNILQYYSSFLCLEH